MLSTTRVYRCPHCGGERLQRNGHAEHGAQRAKCVDCQRTFILSPKGPRYDQKFKDQVVAAYQDRMSIRGITRTFGVCYQTVMAWVGEKIRCLPVFEDTLLPSKKGDVLELDELWSFVEEKAQQCWLWIALCRRTRQVVAYTIGDRSKAGALSLREHIPSDYRRRATRSDFWLAYEETFPQRTHRFCGKEEGETNHAERWFGTLRSRLGRLVRRAYSFSRSVERHLEAIHLFVTTYNMRIQRKSTGS